MKIRIFVLVLCVFLLCGCTDQDSATVVTTDGGAQAEEPSPLPAEPDPEPTSAEPDLEPVDLFETMPKSFLFCSGAGGWSTDLEIEPDGTFTGLFHDSDMGVMDSERFPNGTVYICHFSGRFAQPERLDGTTWTMKLETLELEHPDDESEEIIDGIRYIYSGPYGLENAEELTVYGPDTPAADLEEEVLWAARGPYDWKPTEEGTLGLWIIYNEAEQRGFIQYPLG